MMTRKHSHPCMYGPFSSFVIGNKIQIRGGAEAVSSRKLRRNVCDHLLGPTHGTNLYLCPSFCNSQKASQNKAMRYNKNEKRKREGKGRKNG